MLSHNHSPKSIEDLLNKIRLSQPTKFENEELKAFKKFMLDNEYYDVQCVNPHTREILKEYLDQRAHGEQSKQLIERMVQMIDGEQALSAPLLSAPKPNKSTKFRDLVDLAVLGRVSDLDRFIPPKYQFLAKLEQLCYHSKIPLSEYLVTGYHQSGLSVNDYHSENEFIRELKALPKVTDLIKLYMIEYEKAVSKPLAHFCPKAVRPYKDNIVVIMNYMNEINNGIQKVLADIAAYPIQLDVFFVAPGHHTDKGLDQISDFVIKSDSDSRRNGRVDAVADIYHCFRQAANSINKAHSQRFIMLIVRANTDDATDDTVYIYRPLDERYQSVPDKTFSDPVELLYLINSKQDIVPNLPSSSVGILGWNHHLHSAECNKIYLSYGNYKSRVFKGDLVNNLQLLFDHHNGRRHVVAESARKDFMKDYIDMDDIKYFELGEYWFNNSKQYVCYEPWWNPSNCRAMGNVYIPKSQPCCTQDLLQYIDEEFESPEKLYYKMDYTIGMQIVDKQTLAIKFSEHHFKEQHRGKAICLINTELHRNGDVLYAVIEENKFKSKQRWKIVDYKGDISNAFMTKQQLRDEYGIFGHDLPKGSRQLHKNWAQQIADIKVTKQLIRGTNWSHIRIIQSKQNLGKLGIHDHDDMHSQSEHSSKCKGKSKYHKMANSEYEERQDVISIDEARFKQLAMKALTKHNEKKQALIPSAHFKFRKNKYHIELLLPVFIPEHDKYVAISFWNNQMQDNKRVQATGVCLDLTDMKNKANLIGTIPADSWLSRTTDAMTINNLTITPANHHHDSHVSNNNNGNHSNNNSCAQKKAKKKKNKKNKKKKQQQQQQQQQPLSTPPMTPMSSATDSPPQAPINVFVQSKVASPVTSNGSSSQQISPALQSQMNVTAAPMIPLLPLPQQQFAPPMLAASSFGSVTSTTSSLPSLSGMVSSHSIPSSTSMNANPASTATATTWLNLQPYQQDAQYLAHFLPLTSSPSLPMSANTYTACTPMAMMNTLSATSSVPMVNANANAMYYVTATATDANVQSMQHWPWQ